MTDRRTIQKTLFMGRSDNLPAAMYLDEFQAWLADLTKDVPDEFKGEVQIKFEYESGYDSSDAILTVWYLREETDQEMAARHAQNEANAAASRRYNEQRERQIYEQLRRKFG